MTTKKLPFVSVVVPHKGPDESLSACMESLRRQTYPCQKMEILVVLNEKTQRPLPFELSQREQILWQPEFYSYAARNMGICESSGSVIALTDSDTIPSPDWLTQGIKDLVDGVDMVAGQIVLEFNVQPLTVAACYEKLYSFDQEKNVSLGRASTANLIVKRSLFTQIGSFRSAAESGEDFRWALKAVKSGAVLRYSEQAIVGHPAREKVKELLSKARRVTYHFPSTTGIQMTLGEAANRYWSRYMLPPSASKRQSCTPTQRAIAHVVAVFIQLAKLTYLLLALVKILKLRAKTV